MSALLREHEPCEAADQLGRDLFALNEAAVNYRYAASPHVPQQAGDYSGWSWRGTGAEDNGDGVPGSLTVACDWLKALHCLRYQCTEGEPFERHILYARLTQRIGEFETAIVRGLPEYDTAAWNS